MKLAKIKNWMMIALFPVLAVTAFGRTAVIDDYVPDVTQRVARISSIDGDVQIRRLDSDVWEVADLNLPVVEGDEIVTDIKARVEIQFDSQNYLRLSGRSYLKIVNLKDSGIAVSLSEGSLNARIFEFDAEQTYFEIDAPQTTVAVLEAGNYRVDAGVNEVTVAAKEGEARIYSMNSGFLLKHGRMATIILEGDDTGISDIAASRATVDNFDVWTFELDKEIVERLANANYDEYYDRDIYGAELLNEYGDWTTSPDYGNVWVPRTTTINVYSGWSPYRYGQWRWVPPYGWTWINDEPWGWATYHYGRWIYWNGRWAWSPYSAYRYGRSWWSPALVVMNWYGGYYSWYPLPYSYHYYNYNYHWWNSHHGGNHGGGNPTPTPSPTPDPRTDREPGSGPVTNQPLDQGPIPTSAIITARADTFDRGAYKTIPANDAKMILDRKPSMDSVPPLPPVENTSRSAVARTPIVRTRSIDQVKTGAVDRADSLPVDNQTNRSRVLDGRTIVPNTRPDVKRDDLPGSITPRPTGRVERPTTPVRPTAPRNDTVRPQTPVRPSPPASRPAPSRPSPPASRPAPSRPSPPASRPAPSKPAPSKPAPSKPAPTKDSARDGKVS